MLGGKGAIDPDNPELTRGIAGLLPAFMLEKQQCFARDWMAPRSLRQGFARREPSMIGAAVAMASANPARTLRLPAKGTTWVRPTFKERFYNLMCMFVTKDAGLPGQRDSQ